MASTAVIKELNALATQIHASGINLRRMILFGSYAKNKQTKYSDIDVALVADEFIGVPSEDVKLFLKAIREHYMVQLQTYNTKDFTPDRDPFVEEILKNGIEIKTEEASENHALYHLMDKETHGKALKLKEAKAYYGKLKKKA